MASPTSSLRRSEVQPPPPVPIAPPAPALVEPGIEDRVSERVPLEVSVDLYSASSFYVGFSENISEGGLFVATAAPFEPGDQIWMELALLGEEPVQVLGEVAWVRPDDSSSGLPPGMGLRFVEAPDDLIERIQRLIDERKRELIFFEA